MGSSCPKCFDVDLQDEPLNEMFLETAERVIKSDDSFAKQQPAPQQSVGHQDSEQSLLDLPRINQLQSKLISNSQINMTFAQRLTNNEGLYARVSDKKGPSIIQLDDETPEQQNFTTQQQVVDLVSPSRAHGSIEGQDYQPEFLFRGKAAINSQQK